MTASEPGYFLRLNRATACTLCLLAAACGTTSLGDGGGPADAGLTGPQACNDLATAE